MPHLIKVIALLVLLLVSNTASADVKTGVPIVPSVSSPVTLSAEDKKIKCEQEWKKYRKSQACFAPYRLVNGGIKAEAFKHCREMKQPDLCN
jgi:hypothetical protein